MGAILLSNCCFIVGVLLLKRPWVVFFYLATWDDEPSHDVEFVEAIACSKYQGMFNVDRTEESSPHNIYVDDNLMADTQCHMPRTLVTTAEAIFAIMIQLMLHLRQCAGHR